MGEGGLTQRVDNNTPEAQTEDKSLFPVSSCKWNKPKKNNFVKNWILQKGNGI